jgi:hypothetical protein
VLVVTLLALPSLSLVTYGVAIWHSRTLQRRCTVFHLLACVIVTQVALSLSIAQSLASKGRGSDSGIAVFMVAVVCALCALLILGVGELVVESRKRRRVS